jgi:hypothetical protein
MTINNPWDVLGIKPGSTEDEIKKAYKALAMKYHPDVNDDPGANEKMKEINKAFADVMKCPSSMSADANSCDGYTTVDDLIASMMQSFNSMHFKNMWKFKVVTSNAPRIAIILYSLTPKEAKEGKDIYVYRNGVNLKVHIPAGVMDGQKVMLRNVLKITEGVEGDLIIKIRVVGGG